MVIDLPTEAGQVPDLQQGDVRETTNIGASPSITDFTSSQHTHANAAGGGATTHAGSVGTDHANVGTNNTHVAGDGSDHADVATNTAASHAQAHTIASHSDTAVTGAELTAAESASHTQNTDTALGSGAVAADHGTASTDQIVNVSYGTGAPPTASTTTEGSLFVKYTA